MRTGSGLGFATGLATLLDEVKARGERPIRRDALVRQHGLSDRQAVALDHVAEGRAANSLEPIFTVTHAITADVCGSMYVRYASRDHPSAGRPD